MILVPQRLFDSPHVRTLARDGNNCLLHKSLPASQHASEAYVANHVVSLVLSGKQIIRNYEDEVITARAGQALFLPRGVYYITDLLAGGGQAFESLLFYFDDDAIHRFLSVLDVSEVDRDAAASHLRFGESALLSTFVTGTLGLADNMPLTDALLSLKTTELLHLLHQLSARHTFARFLFRLTLPKQRNLRQFMERNYHKPLGVEDYAYLTGRSLSSFRRDFRAYFNTTPNKWLRQRRMEQAVALLQAGEMSVSALSYSVGYENTSYFIREFRKVTGVTPKQYMLSHRDGGRPIADA